LKQGNEARQLLLDLALLPDWWLMGVTVANEIEVCCKVL
jgi:hypothetical protein